MPPLHPLVVHFPIALFLAAVLFDTVTAFRARNVDQPFSDPRLARKELRRYDVATRLLLVFSLLGSAVAVLTGEWLKPARASFVPAKLLSLHQVLAFAFLAWLLILTVLRLRLSWQPSKWYMMASFIGALLLGSVGYTGATMAWPASIVPVTASAQSGSTGDQQPGGAPTATTTQTATGSASTRKKSSGSASGTGSSTQSQGTNSGTTGASGGNNGGSNAVVLQVGMTSAAVTTLQQELSALGLFHHSFTQYYGPVTETAVRAFQSQHRLPVTGSVDQSTLQSIQQAAASAPSGSTTGSGEEGSSGSSSGGSGGSSGGAGSSSPSAGSGSSGGSTGTSSGGGSTQNNGIDQVRYNSGYQAFVNGCQSCHSLGVAEQYYGQLSPSQWSSIVSQMNSYAGGTIPNSSDIIYYLEHHK